MSSKKSLRNNLFEGLPSRIRKIRGELTQEGFGKVIGVSQGTVNKYEKGLIFPKYPALKNIANYGEVTVGWLLKGEGATTPAQTAEHAPEIYEARPVELDVNALTRVITTARAYLRRHPQLLSDRGEAKLFTDLYYYWLTEKFFPDDQVIKHYIPLAKRADLKKED